MSTVTRLYSTWRNMRHRCLNPLNREYKRYGARGITVCERWMKFENFKADMGEKPDGSSLERIDVNGPYEPGNCKWATPLEQRLNQRPGTLTEVAIGGETKPLRHWAREIGIDERTVHGRIRRGMPPSDALTRPIDKRARNKRYGYV